MNDTNYNLSNQSYVENGELEFCICSLVGPCEDNDGNEDEDGNPIILYYLRGNHHTGTGGPSFIMVAKWSALNHVKTKFSEPEINAISFESLSIDQKKYFLEGFVPRGYFGWDHEYDEDGKTVEITKKLADMISALIEYTNEIVGINEDGTYFLTEKATGYGEGDGSFSSEGADSDDCGDLQEYGCLPFRGWIS